MSIHVIGPDAIHNDSIIHGPHADPRARRFFLFVITIRLRTS